MLHMSQEVKDRKLKILVQWKQQIQTEAELKVALF